MPGAAICDVAANYFLLCSSEDICDKSGRNGVLYPKSRVRLADITDGTSQMFAVSERRQRGGQVTWVGAVPGANVFAVEGDAWLDANIAMTLAYTENKSNPGDVGGGWVSAHHTSAHGVGANFLFCDGRVPSFDYITFNAVATRAGEEVVSAYY
jgi:prepilin-type processing-associated H-X9-DG protein